MQADPEQVSQIEIVEIVEIVENSYTTCSSAMLVAHNLCISTYPFRFLPALFLMATALINGTHGLGFALKLGLMGVMLSDACILVIAVCGNTSAIVIACAETYHTGQSLCLHSFSPEPLPSVLFVPGSGQSPVGQASYRCTHSGRTAHIPRRTMRPVRTVAPQITALCQTAAVVVGAAVAHLTPGPKTEPESESKLKPYTPNPNQAVPLRMWLSCTCARAIKRRRCSSSRAHRRSSWRNATSSCRPRRSAFSTKTHSSSAVSALSSRTTTTAAPSAAACLQDLQPSSSTWSRARKEHPACQTTNRLCRRRWVD